MGNPMAADFDFKSQFYNLQGIHINDRKKNFYKLLKLISPDKEEDQVDIQPRNYQENIFYVDVLIYFRKVETLIEILKQGNGVLSSKILKEQWLFQEAFKNMNEDDIVNKFLPTLGYSLQMKVLKKLSLALSEERMDTIFDLVLERYGLFTAKQFLFSCSPEKIIHILRNNEIVLLSEQLKRLLQKDPDLLKVYFEEYKRHQREDFHDNHFLSYLVWKHPNLYFRLGLNTKSNVKVGRFTSRAVIKINKEDVLKDIQNCWLNKTALVGEIKEFDKEYLFLFFPDDMETINNSSSLEYFVSKYPIKKRWEVLAKAFKQAYNEEIVEHLDSFEINLAKFFPKNILHRWAKIKYLKSGKLKYIKCYEPKKAFKLLHDKINVTSNFNRRNKLLRELINVCYENEDYSTYEEVLKYICTRFRDEDSKTHDDIIYHIFRNIDYNVITEVHWKYINEIIDMQSVNEILRFALIAEYLLFVYKKTLPLEEPVTKYVKDCINVGQPFRLWYNFKEPEAESAVLKHVLKIFPTMKCKDRRYQTYRIMSDIVDFNKDIKNDKSFNKEFKKLWIDLSECEFIIDLIKEISTKQVPYDYWEQDMVRVYMLYNHLYSEKPLQAIDENHYLNIIKTMTMEEDGSSFTRNLLDVIKKPQRNKLEDTLLAFFFTKDTTCFMKQNAVRHFSTKEPEVIAQYFSEILALEERYETYVLDYDFIKRYGHLGLDKKVIAHFKTLVLVNSPCDKKYKLLKCLSKIMNTTEFLHLVKDYTPDARKLDLANAVQKELYPVQCGIAKVFKNLEEPSLVAPVLMHYCQGDYLRSSLPSLYKVLYRVNEKQALCYLNMLGERAVSTRKLAVPLGFKLLPLKDAITIYSVLSNKETNISAKKYLFTAELKYFMKNPLGSLLDIVFLNTDFVDKNDTELIETWVQSVNKIPNKYTALFIERVWNFLDLLEGKEVNVISFRNILVHALSGFEMSFILRLNKKFCENLIKTYFFSSDGRLLTISDELDYFVVNYLLAYLDETHFEFVFSIIKNYKDVLWKSDNKDRIPHVITFFSKACEKFDENDMKFLKLFTSFWQRLFSHEESLPEYTLLSLMALYKENTDIETFSKEVDKFFREHTAEFGPYINELLINSLKSFFCNISTKQNPDFTLGNLVYCMLGSNPSELNCLIAFSIIKDFTSTDQKKIYSKVVGALENVTNFTANACWNALLQTLPAVGTSVARKEPSVGLVMVEDWS